MREQPQSLHGPPWITGREGRPAIQATRYLGDKPDDDEWAATSFALLPLPAAIEVRALQTEQAGAGGANKIFCPPSSNHILIL